jgi:hypothetical protein
VPVEVIVTGLSLDVSVTPRELLVLMTFGNVSSVGRCQARNDRRITSDFGHFAITL